MGSFQRASRPATATKPVRPAGPWHGLCDPQASETAWGRSQGVKTVQKHTRGMAMIASIEAVAKRPRLRLWLAATAGVLLGLSAAGPATAQETIKIGILH